MKFLASKRRNRIHVELKPRDADVLAESLQSKTTAAPFQLKRVLVPVDFSGCSKKALKYAVPFAKHFGATLVLVYVVPLRPAITDAQAAISHLDLEEQMRAGAQAELEALVRKQVRTKVPTRTVVRVGHPYHEIVRAAREENADLIIISTHGHTGLKHMFLGSTSESVLRYANCPVLVVREHEHEFLA